MLNIIEKVTIETEDGRVQAGILDLRKPAHRQIKFDLEKAFAENNLPVIYKGDTKPKFDPNLHGSALIEKAWEADYGDLDKMRQRQRF